MTSRARERFTRGVVPGGRTRQPNPRYSGARRRCERGATFVEYALLLGALVVPTIAGIQYVQGSAEVKVNQTAAGISSRTIPSLPPDSSGGGGGGGGGTSSTSSSVAPPSTPPTTPPTSTTTIPPATTTTTTAPAPKLTGTWGATTNNASGSGSSRTWIGTAVLKVTNSSGAVVANASVTVSVECNDGSKWSSDGSATVTTNSSGLATFTSTAHKTRSTESNYASKFRFTVTTIAKAGSTWDGSKPVINVSKP